MGPIALIAAGAEVAILGPEFFMRSATPGVADTAKQMQDMAQQMRTASEHLPLLYGLSFLMAPFFMGLGLAPSAFAYRALTRGGQPNSGFNQAS